MSYTTALQPAWQPALINLSAVAVAVRWALNFNGVNTFGRLPYRLINPEGPIDIEFKTGAIVPAVGCAVVSQSFSSNFGDKEFILQINSGGKMQILHGGSYLASNSLAPPIEPFTTYRMTYVGNTITYYRNGQVTQIANGVRGTKREPSAPTVVGAWAVGGSFGGFYRGVLYDVKINGTLFPMSEQEPAIQLPVGSYNPVSTVNLFNNSSIGVLANLVDGNGFSVMTLPGTQTYSYLGFNIPVIQGMTYLVETLADYTSSNIFYGSNSNTATNATQLAITVNVPANKIHRQLVTTQNQNFLLITRNTPNNAVGTFKAKLLRAIPVGVPQTELVTNGNFNNGTAGWNATGGGSLAISGGQAVLTTAAAQASRFEQSIALETGSYYLATADLVSLSGVTAARINVIRGLAGSYAGVANVQLNAVGKLSMIFLATGSDALVQIVGDSNNAGTLTVDNVSVKKLDSFCNPLVLNNIVPEQWVEVPA